MSIADNMEAKKSITKTYMLIPEDLQDEYLEISSGPIPKAAFQVSQFIYVHRDTLPTPVVQVGYDLLHYCTYVGEWNGLPTGLGPNQLKYLSAVLNDEDLDEDEAPEVHPQAGIKVPETLVESPEIPMPETDILEE